MEKMNTYLCNYMLATGSLAAAFTNMELRLYSGTVPATADSADTGTVQVTINNSGSYLAFGTASGGVITQTNTMSSTASNTALLTYYRILSHTDTGGSAPSSSRIQGTIGVGGSDMNVASANTTSGSAFVVNVLSQAIVPS
jgi:hypothetical protein